jgi:hypothetical protein
VVSKNSELCGPGEENYTLHLDGRERVGGSRSGEKMVRSEQSVIIIIMIGLGVQT